MGELRVIDAGRVSPARSQYLWHGIASAMGPEACPTLSLCRPTRPYLCLGYHRSLEEVDRALCRERGWQVFRRQLGGGPVYVDSDQLLFQLTLPAAQAPLRVDLLYSRLLAPAVEAFRALGLAADLSGLNDIAVGGRKISGTGAGRIADAVTVVGNVIFRFPHERMASALSLPSETMRRHCLQLMRRHVSSLELEGLPQVDFAETTAALVRSYARGLELTPAPGVPTEPELAEIGRWEGRAADPRWLAGPVPTRGFERGSGRQVKICHGVWLFTARDDDLKIEMSVVDSRLDSVSIEGRSVNGIVRDISRSLRNLPADQVVITKQLEQYGALGRRVAELLGPGLVVR